MATYIIQCFNCAGEYHYRQLPDFVWDCPNCGSYEYHIEVVGDNNDDGSHY